MVFAGRRGDRVAAARDLLARVGVEHLRDHLPGELAGGEQQRVAVARALANRPPLLLADEPTGNLDAATGAAVLDLLVAYWRDGGTLVLVTHDPAIAARAPRVVRLADGALVPAPVVPPVAAAADD
jgi:putative ABC transport system ATP-binding protein